MTFISRLLEEPLLRGLDLDGPERIQRHQHILRNKPLIRGIFKNFYDLYHELDTRTFGTTPGIRIEVGAGVTIIKDFYPDVLVSDLVPAGHLDVVLDATKMALSDASVRALYASNCFHHIPKPECFFSELDRVVHPGGGAIIIEPYFGPLAQFIFKRLFSTETFEPDMAGWQHAGDGPMRGANQALSHIVFQRDRSRFKCEYPTLEIAHEKPLNNALRYLFSGGLNFRQFLPSFAVGSLELVEKALSPLLPYYALHHVIVLKKL